MLAEKVMCSVISPHLYILLDIQVQCYTPLHQVRSIFGDFHNGVCLVMKITVAESNPDVEFFRNISVMKFVFL